MGCATWASQTHHSPFPLQTCEDFLFPSITEVLDFELPLVWQQTRLWIKVYNIKEKKILLICHSAITSGCLRKSGSSRLKINPKKATFTLSTSSAQFYQRALWSPKALTGSSKEMLLTSWIYPWLLKPILSWMGESPNSCSWEVGRIHWKNNHIKE